MSVAPPAISKKPLKITISLGAINDLLPAYSFKIGVL